MTATLQLQGLIYDCLFCAPVIAKIKASTSKQRLSKARAGAIVSATGDNGSRGALTNSSGH
jgi:hypothetical protein